MGTFENRNEIETSFNLPDPDSCLKMLDKARETNFFGLVVEASELKATEALFEPEV